MLKEEIVDYRYPSAPREITYYNGYDTDEDCHKKEYACTSCDCDCHDCDYDEEFTCDCDIEDPRLTNIKSRHDIKKYLKEPNINIKKRDKYGNSILHLAIIYDIPLKLIENILEYVIDIDCINKNYSTPLYLASMNGNIDLIHILLNRGANIDSSHISYHRARRPLHIASELGKLDAINVLIDRGAYIHYKDHLEMTPLIVASHHGQSGAIKILLERGANIHEKGVDDMTALHYASSSEVVEELLKNHMNINQTDKYGRTPLNTACNNIILEFGFSESEYNKKEVVEILLTCGADIDLAEPILCENREIVDIIERWSFTMSIILLEELCVYNVLDYEEIKYLCDYTKPINIKCKDDDLYQDADDDDLYQDDDNEDANDV